MLFTNDTLILCDANKEHMEHLSWALMCFKAISILKINLEKSELIPVRSIVAIEDLARL